MSWYRTYRPMNFSDLVGQEYIRKILLASLQKGAPVHAYLFSGPRGTGKTSTARILGKALNCKNSAVDHEPCNSCLHCMEINEQRFVDLIEIDAASNTGVDHIRDLRDKIGFSPTSGKAKVYIIDEVHMLSTGAFNALLKTLEEPPSFVYFILATTEIHKVPETIQSRCQRFSFRRIITHDIVQRLSYIAEQEQIDTEKEALEMIATRAAGGLRDAISLLEQYATAGTVKVETLQTQMGIVSHMTVQNFLTALQTADASSALVIIDELVTEGFSLAEFLRAIVLCLREVMLQNMKKDEGMTEILEYIEIFEEAQHKMKFAIIPQLPLEVAVIKATQDASSPVKKQNAGGILSIFGGREKKSDHRPDQKKGLPPQEVKKNTDASEEKKLAPAAECIAPEFTLEGIRSAWPQLLEKLENSLFRMSLRNAELVALQEGVLQLQVPAETWKEKIEDTKNQQAFSQVFADIFSRKITISCTVQSVQLEPTIEEKKQEASVTEQSSSPVEMLEEIMGAKAEKKPGV